MKRWILILLGFAFVALNSGPTNAQIVCGERDKFLGMLGRTHAEQPVSMGITSTGAVIELLTSPSGSWTILITSPEGPTCMVASGESWQPLPSTVHGSLS